ncbi:hypothetical protein [Flaviflexus huanghaiensis]|uniref:hypothetical protein n=1 Tax=Flaviflexus huanghaiensis TaxID=1111473 RepID=UPI0015FB9FD3|nr:hypothetical protein [Flaviflexus huanghaiensis]
MKLSNAVLRAVPGAFILNSGIGKLGMDDETAEYLQNMAKVAVPVLGNMSPREFGKFLSYGETVLGVALLLPIVPTRVAGLALATFGAGMAASYLKLPGMTQADGIRPTDDGVPLAKDTWLLAIGVALALRGSK